MMKNLLVFPLLLSLAAVSHAFATGIDPRTLCSNESERHLAKLQLKGETRFSDFQFDPDSTKVTEVEFTDMGATGGRRHRHRAQIPAKPEYGQMLVMKAMGKEKQGWRNLVVKCGVNKGKVATITYEILTLSDKSAVASAASSSKPAASSAADTLATPTTPTVAAPAATESSPSSSPGPASVQNH